MSKAREKLPPAEAARMFAALGEETRLSLVKKLGRGKPLSATELATGADITRQAVSKHLDVLAAAGLVTSAREGRAVLYSLEGARLKIAQQYLENVSAAWDTALLRLKAFVEDEDP